MITFEEGIQCYIVTKDEVKFFGKIRCVFSSIVVFDDPYGRSRVINRGDIIRIHYFRDLN